MKTKLKKIFKLTQKNKLVFKSTTLKTNLLKWRGIDFNAFKSFSTNTKQYNKIETRTSNKKVFHNRTNQTF